MNARLHSDALLRSLFKRCKDLAMGICLSSKEGSSLKTIGRSNKIKDCSSYTSKDNQQSRSGERKDFTFSRDEADNLLNSAAEGTFLLSEDISSERFISVCSGQYVAHHAIFNVPNGITVGGEVFESISEMLDYFRQHPLGKTKLQVEYTTPQHSSRKDFYSKTSCSKSESSFQMTSALSPEHQSEVSEHRSLKRLENRKSDIEPLPEEEVVPAHDATAAENIARRESEARRKSQLTRDGIETSVSSADEQDLPMDEPIPILPEQNGDRPPPLFQGLASKSLSSLGFQSFGHNIRMSTFKFSNVEPKETQLSCLSTRMIRIVVCGKPDTMIERDFLIQDCLTELSDFCSQFGFVCDIINWNSKDRQSKENSSWVIEDRSVGLTSEEIAEIKRFGIPVLLLGCFGEKMGPMTIPIEISSRDFDRMEMLLSSENMKRLKDFYEVDENDNCRSFVLKKDVEEGREMREDLVNICKILLSKCFEGEKDLWKNFQPETEKHVKTLLSNLDDIEFIPIERKITDLRKCMRSISIIEAYEDDQDANSYYQLESMRNEFRGKMLERAKLGETDVITLSTLLAAVKQESEERESYIETMRRSLKPHIKSKLVEMMQKFPSLGSYQFCLRDEIYTHLFECQRRSKEFVGHADVLRTVKAYLQGPYTKPLILYGDSGCGRSSVIAKSSEMAKEWVGSGASVITRFIGSTRDSTSLHLLLQSICLQLSYAYKTDPAAVPQNLPDLVQFLPNLFQFATDSQPLVIFIAALDDVETFDDEFSWCCFVPPSLQYQVKIVLSVHKNKLEFVQQLYPDINSYREIPSKTMEDGIEMLDRMLVAAERTLSEQQKAAISNSMNSCWSPVYVNILFHKAKSWRGNEKVNLPSQVDLKQYINDIFLAAENTHGYGNVSLISSLITVSQFGISKGCLCHALVQEHTESNGLPLTKAREIVTNVMKAFASIVSMKWLNGHVVCTWFHQYMQLVVNERYLKETDAVNDVTEKIVYHFQNEPNALKSIHATDELVVSDTDPVHHDVRKSPSNVGVSQSKSPRKSLSQKQSWNLQKLQLLPLYLLRCSRLSELKKDTICNYDFLYDKLQATSVGHIVNDFYYALAAYSHDLDLKILKEFFELSIDALALDPEQFSAQIFARLHLRKQEVLREDVAIDNASEIEKKMLPPPDGKESTSSEGSENGSRRSSHINGIARMVAAEDSEKGREIRAANDQNSGGGLSNDNDTRKFGVDTVVKSYVSESSILMKIIDDSLTKGHLLMPSYPCLIRPPSESGAFPETQMSSFLAQPIDTRILFSDRFSDTFISWSRSKGTIAVYDSRCTRLKLFTELKLHRVVLTINHRALVEMQNGKICLFDLTSGEITAELNAEQRYFAVCDNAHVASLSDNLTCLNVYSLRSSQVVWDYRAPEGRHFHNVLVSKNGAIGACILEADSFRNSREDLSFSKLDDAGSSCMQDEITVVNLKSRQQLHSISLKNGQFFHKICAISEDGHYLVHLTEPDYKIFVLDLVKGVIVHEMEARLHRILKILVSTQGNCILSASADSVLRVWNLSDGDLRYSLSEPIRSIRGGYMDDKHCLSMSEDGSRAVHSVTSQFHYSYVVLWDLVQGQQLATFTTDFYGLKYQISPCGDYVVCSMPSGIVTMGALGPIPVTHVSSCIDEVE